MQQVQKIVSRAEAQKLIQQYQAVPVDSSTYKLPNGMLLSVGTLPDGRIRLIISKGSCVC